MRLGAGMVALGYGSYRLARGSRGLVTSASLSAGASMILGGLRVRSPFQRGPQVAQVADAVGRAADVVAHQIRS